MKMLAHIRRITGSNNASAVKGQRTVICPQVGWIASNAVVVGPTDAERLAERIAQVIVQQLRQEQVASIHLAATVIWLI